MRLDVCASTWMNTGAVCARDRDGEKERDPRLDMKLSVSSGVELHPVCSFRFRLSGEVLHCLKNVSSKEKEGI
ncbi:hypothetical protein FQA47_025076 [Oryzias melastigma]|uniref:Uncharacterized protein n=1 Tax=Oryzias melastigma TaxID=30732 RepID=A0A834CXI6_ORYME|nr:hypothetical protein FQA47_025076 [Oryzias melastigma]